MGKSSIGFQVWEDGEYSHPFYCRHFPNSSHQGSGEWLSDNLVSKYPFPDKSLNIAQMNFIPKLVNQEIWVETFWNHLKIESDNLYILYPKCYKIPLKAIEVDFF